jgi:hypothetical protein
MAGFRVAVGAKLQHLFQGANGYALPGVPRLIRIASEGFTEQAQERQVVVYRPVIAERAVPGRQPFFRSVSTASAIAAGSAPFGPVA